MKECNQFQSASHGQSILAHGDSVYAHYQALLWAAQNREYPMGWRSPKWWTPDIASTLAAEQPESTVMQNYLRYHDCGKPLVRRLDAEGRAHFPDHAEVSAALWEHLQGQADEVWLMRHDMLLHQGSAEACQAIQGHRLMPGLLFAALAEIHSNAQMFGGVESSSFKMKAKQLDRRGSTLIRAL